MSYHFWKRIGDWIGALTLVLLFAVLFIGCAILIKAEDPEGPVLFKQKRIGKNEKEFLIYKFRSMKTGTHRKNRRLSDKERMLRVGRILRNTSLDELPQLFNILKGEMSFIGPRPLLPEYVPYYSQEERKRHTVFPGISGLAQVNGRTAIQWEERFAYDTQYAEEVCLGLDVRILVKTIQKVFQKSDIVDAGEETTQALHEIRQEPSLQPERSFRRLSIPVSDYSPSLRSKNKGDVGT